LHALVIATELRFRRKSRKRFGTYVDFRACEIAGRRSAFRLGNICGRVSVFDAEKNGKFRLAACIFGTPVLP
jgi:hypothetical protein